MNEKPTWLKRAIIEGDEKKIKAAAKKGGEAAAESKALFKVREAMALAEHMKKQGGTYVVDENGDVMPPE